MNPSVLCTSFLLMGGWGYYDLIGPRAAFQQSHSLLDGKIIGLQTGARSHIHNP